ncbi:MAG TPA: glycosyltransferase family A protein [Casimicrobiaceae bacterium]|nr:glycosyltransferase family A protein [Casimicrobiaceae bacterium]
MAAEGSLPRLKGAIDCYCRQTYRERELIIVGLSEPRVARAVAAYVDQLDRSDVLLLASDPGVAHQSNPMVRGLRVSNGPLACIWAANDLSHPSRLAIQVAQLEATGANAVSMSDRLCFLWWQRLLYWVDESETTNCPELAFDATTLGRSDVLETLLASASDRYSVSEEIARQEGVGHCCVRLVGDLSTQHSIDRLGEELERMCRSVATVESRRDDLGEALSHYRLPRPYLIKGRLPEGTVTTIDIGH